MVSDNEAYQKSRALVGRLLCRSSGDFGQLHARLVAVDELDSSGFKRGANSGKGAMGRLTPTFLKVRKSTVADLGSIR